MLSLAPLSGVVSRSTAYEFRHAYFTLLIVLAATNYVSAEVPEKWPEPERIDYQQGHKPIPLTAEWAHNKILGTNDKIDHQSYDGKLVGPTIFVGRGTVLEIELRNNLKKEYPDQRNFWKKNEYPEKDALNPRAHVNFPREFNVTNLHTHGLHVHPSEDDVLNTRVEPEGGRHPYRYTIPKDHPAGTFWYHPHHHGSTALQISNGMAGLLIVKGELDEFLRLKKIDDRFFVFQQIPYRFEKKAVELDDVYRDGDAAPEDCQKAILTNGEKSPRFKMKVGEIARWRMLNAGTPNTVSLKVSWASSNQEQPDSPKMSDNAKRGQRSVPLFRMIKLGFDGIPPIHGTLRDEIRLRGAKKPTDTSIDLAPGNRCDVLVQFNREGDYVMHWGDNVNETILAQIRVDVEKEEEKSQRDYPIPQITWPEEDNPQQIELQRLLVSDAGVFAKPPDDLPEKAERTFLLRDSSVPFGIHVQKDRYAFHDKGAQVELTLNKTIRWEIKKTNDHPFHMHTNPFFVRRFDNLRPRNVEDMPVYEGWQDTVSFDENDDKDEPRFSNRYFLSPKVFEGDAVMHCHKLHHEDQGMMWKVRFKENKNGQTGYLNTPKKAPQLALPDSDRKLHKLQDYAGRRIVLILFRGASCSHCMEQLRVFAQNKKKLDEAKLVIIAVSPDAPPELDAVDPSVKKLPFPVLFDKNREAFVAFGSDRSSVIHGTFLIDEMGRVFWQDIGVEPFANVNQLIQRQTEYYKRQTLSK